MFQRSTKGKPTTNKSGKEQQKAQEDKELIEKARSGTLTSKNSFKAKRNIEAIETAEAQCLNDAQKNRRVDNNIKRKLRCNN